MQPARLKSFYLIIILIAATGAAMAYSSGAARSWFAAGATPSIENPAVVSAPVTLSGRLVQDKVLQGSDGSVNLALTLQTSDSFGSDISTPHHADMVIVLDRSGSMNGRKINDARQAVLNLYPVFLQTTALL